MAFFAQLGFKAAAPLLTRVAVAAGAAVGALALSAIRSKPRWDRGEDDDERHYEQSKESDSEKDSDQQSEATDTEEEEEGDQQSEESDSEEEEEEENDQQSEESDSEEEEEKNDQQSEESDSEEEENDQQSDSEEEETEESQRSISVYNDQNTPASIFIGLLNVRSLNNKMSRILDLIVNNRLDVLCTTETWLNENTGEGVLRRASPEDFRFYYQTRPSRGGGAAVQVRQVLQSIPIYFRSKITTFEVAATILQHETWPEPVLVISLYHRGSRGTSYQLFMGEFQDVLCEIFDLCNNIIVTGDFNIWIDDLRRGRMFRWLLQAYELDQHVRGATHNRGRTLDLVITRNIQVSRLSVENNRISDHYCVFFSARPEVKYRRKKTKREEKNQKRRK